MLWLLLLLMLLEGIKPISGIWYRVLLWSLAKGIAVRDTIIGRNTMLLLTLNLLPSEACLLLGRLQLWCIMWYRVLLRSTESHWLLVLLDGVEEIDQIWRRTFRFGFHGRGLSIYCFIGGALRRHCALRRHSSPIRHGFCALLRFQLRQILPSICIKVLIIEIFFQGSCETGRCMFELRYFQSCGMLVHSRSTKILYHLICLLGKGLVDCQCSFSIISRHLKVVF